MKRRLVLRGATTLLLVASCAPVHEVVADTSGRTATEYSAKEFVARVVGNTEDVWDALFKAMGHAPYPRPTVVLFRWQVQTACGRVNAAVGPLYCPAVQNVYLDPAFLSELSQRVGATGNFLQAYLIVHEISHHVQNTLGTTRQFEPRSGMTEEQRNQLHVRFELQADCYTGVWAYFAQKRNLLEPGDLEESLAASHAAGDATKNGDAAQRLWWFKQGLATGDPRKCDTFVVSQP